ncbi:PREDICTED: breast carcinoma-amplified sequence 1 isoform X1 [Chinchilla lanigera]|uniref:breast carcinoma-amplified sequence 1 isoform X1 n=1 Tax=Chinchilla lanigera TaxID=34839 RepID=UPI000696B55F|nr:PREDICTED: breast carcinoma-amplified sequence 1 isoform X1 [Chinchilla lanigera]
MGNQLSVPQRAEEEEREWDAGTYKVTVDSECAQNGTPVIISTRTIQHYDEVDLGIGVQKDNAAASSPKTMEISTAADASGTNLGKEAKPEAPAAKSRFFLTLSRPVPGRTGDQGTDSSAGAAKLDVSSNSAPANKDPSDSPALGRAAAPGPATDKIPELSAAADQALPATWVQAPLPPASEGAAPSKPKDSSFFEKFFKLDKGREKAAAEDQQEAKEAGHQDEAEEVLGPPGKSQGVPAAEDIGDSQEAEGQAIEALPCSVPGDPEELEIAEEGPPTTETAESNTSIMSFFKTLVSPNKAETKKDPEDTKASKAESICDGQVGQKMSESQGKGSKKKHLDSPRLGLAFRKFFRHQGAEKSPNTAANLKSDKANAPSQETQNPKGSPLGEAPSTAASGTAKEGGKEKAGPTSLPLGKLFWKKSVKEKSVPAGAEENVVCESPVETVKSEEVESTLHTVDLSEETDAPPEPAEVKRKREEGKPRRISLMALFRQGSVRGDGGITHSEEINGKDSNNQTSNSTEKATTPKAATPPEPEPTAAAQKGREGSAKDRKAAAETNKQKSNKQEAKEPAPCAQQAAAEISTPQSGGKSPRRPEKRRQSLGGFLKGLGPKRMSDAQVQTDPVSIGPPGKSK